MIYTREDIKTFYNLSHAEQMEKMLEELAIHIRDIQEMRTFCEELAVFKMQVGNQFTAQNYFNCIRMQKYEYLRRDDILKNLLAFNGDITQFENFKKVEKELEKLENIEANKITKSILNMYDNFVINYLNEEGTDKVENYVESFMCWLLLPTNKLTFEELQKKLHTTNARACEYALRCLLCKYEGLKMEG